jgi:uncharacterized protein YbbC (DUF1343 family)
MMKFGIDNIKENFACLDGLKLALICNGTSFSSSGVSTIEIINEYADLALLLAPEHGIRGDKDAGESFGTDKDAVTGLDVISLYRRGSQDLPEKELDEAGINALVYDIQDIGMRCYTYISTLYLALHYCARMKKPLVVLDRPNPLGRQIEGLILEESCKSFVGIYPIASRYGLTCGEFANLVNLELKLGVDLRIVRCSDYNPLLLYPQLGKRWIVPSPAIIGFENALLYSAFFLLEATNVSEGRGTSSPFSFLGAPFADSDKVCECLHQARCPGVEFLPADFTPDNSKHRGVLCHGVMARITDAGAFNGIRTGLVLLEAFKTLYPDDFALDREKLKRLLGTRKSIAQVMEDGFGIVKRDEEEFASRARKAMIY